MSTSDAGPRGVSPHAASTAAPVVPSRVGPYRIEGELGRGGMGVVYRAFDERFEREVALKALPASLAADAQQRTLLEQEARALAVVSHPNVAAIRGMEGSASMLYLVLELVPGRTLHARIDDGAMDLGEATAVCAQVASGLEAVHRAGLVHRDVTPANIMVTPEGIAKILDFGLAGPREASLGEGVAGTPGYASPEQIRGEPLDVRSDAFAWGCLLFECLTGEPPFRGATTSERIEATIEREPPWERLPESLPADVRRLLRSCLAKDRALRPASMDEARARLEAASLPSGTPARPRARVVLPTEHDEFVGREDELGALRRHLLDERAGVVSVVGMGGTGKTRLAVRFARRHADDWPGGAWFCDLSEARSVDQVAQAAARALDVPLGKDEPVVQLGHAIAGRGRCLVILDNFEHVARHAPATLGRWVERCGEASFLVTTRELLGLPGERALELAPLDPPDALELFHVRAKAARRGHVDGVASQRRERGASSQAASTIAPADRAPAKSSDVASRSSSRSGEDPADAEKLVALLDHVPLAIELAAARLRLMSVSQVLARMDDRFRLLARSGRRERQSTLRATLDWSWDLLAEWEKAALAQLSVFEGGVTRESAEAVLDLGAWPDAPWTADVVQALLDKSLLRRVDEERHDLLASVKDYASDKLRMPGAFPGSGARAESAAQARHGAFFARYGSEGAIAALDAHGGPVRRRHLSRELDNVVAACRRAVSRGDGAIAAATCSAAAMVLELSGPFAAGASLAESVLSACDLDVRDRAALARLAGRALQLCGRRVEARASYDSALAGARASGSRHLEGLVLGSLGSLHHEHGRMDEARSCYEASIAIAREFGDRQAEGVRLANLGILHRDQGRLEEARACHQSALAVHRERGDRRCEGLVLGYLGTLELDLGRLDEARALYDAALAIVRAVGDRRSEGILLSNHGCVAHDQGRIADAQACYATALVLLREVGNRRFEGVVLGNLGSLHLELGRMQEAVECFDAALVIHREVGNTNAEGIVLGCLALVRARAGLLAEARTALSGAESLLVAVGDRIQVAVLLCSRAEIEHLAGAAAEARAALDEAERVADEMRVGPASELGRSLARARAALARTQPAR